MASLLFIPLYMNVFYGLQEDSCLGTKLTCLHMGVTCTHTHTHTHTIVFMHPTTLQAETSSSESIVSTCFQRYFYCIYNVN